MEVQWLTFNVDICYNTFTVKKKNIFSRFVIATFVLLSNQLK